MDQARETYRSLMRIKSCKKKKGKKTRKEKKSLATSLHDGFKIFDCLVG